MAVAGKVAITLSTENGGAWSADVTYDRLVAVKHNNNLYISRKTVANVEPPNNEFWFLALEGFSGDDIEKIISGETVVGNANLLEGLTAEQVGESGARNLIPYPYYETTHAQKGITWTVNEDGTITANGTATDLSQFYFCNDITMGLEPNKTYSLSGCPSGGSSSTYQVRAIMNFQKDGAKTAVDVGNGVTFTTNDSYSVIRIMIDIFQGTTVENLTFRPMLELGSVAHDYVPYHFGGAEDAKTVNGFAVYTDITQLGLTNTATLLEVYNAMPYLSELECNSSVLTDASWNFPSAAGTVKIVKISVIRGYLEFRQKIGASFYWMGLDDSSPSLPDGVWHNIGDGGNAKTLDGHGAEYFAPLADLAKYLLLTSYIPSEIKVNSSETLRTRNTSGIANYFHYYGANSDLGYLGFSEANNPSFLTTGGVTQILLHSGNFTNYALSKNGGHVGNSASDVVLNAHGLNHSLIGYSKNGALLGMLGFTNANEPKFLKSDWSAGYQLLHTGNKPSGTYTGNGSATGRTVAVGGIGNCLMVRRVSSEDLAIVTESGYIGKKGGTVVCGADTYYSRGGQHLYMATTSELFNADGGNYYYELL